MKTTSTFKLVTATAVAALSVATAAFAADPDSCSTVHFSDVGWTDITATTATASVVLKSIGYQTDVKVLSVPVTYTSLKNKDIDIFLGNWMPTQEKDVRPYIDDKSVESFWSAPSTRSPPTPKVQSSASRTSRISPPTRTISTARSTGSSPAMTATASSWI